MLENQFNKNSVLVNNKRQEELGPLVVSDNSIINKEMIEEYKPERKIQMNREISDAYQCFK